jgi:hypothetical protein
MIRTAAKVVWVLLLVILAGGAVSAGASLLASVVLRLPDRTASWVGDAVFVTWLIIVAAYHLPRLWRHKRHAAE